MNKLKKTTKISVIIPGPQIEVQNLTSLTRLKSASPSTVTSVLVTELISFVSDIYSVINAMI
jgi:hypothetical protein